MFIRKLPALLLAANFAVIGNAHAEGSRDLYPADYPAAGSRADLDLQSGSRYIGRVNRRGVIYAYAQAGEYLVLGSSNISRSGDIRVYNPQDFGTRGDETLPGSADFSCQNGPAVPGGTHFSGGGRGMIDNRTQELAGPGSADGGIAGGYAPCAYQVPEDGIYLVEFTGGSRNRGPNGGINLNSNVDRNRTVAMWEVAVRSDAATTTDSTGRVFTYAFLGFTGGNNRPVFSSLYYVTGDGYRYRQDLRGIDPNGYALYANTFGFYDQGEPLYKTLRGNNALISGTPPGVSAAAAEFPIFFVDIEPGAAAAADAEQVLQALNIPLVPPSPQLENVSFNGSLGGASTTTGVGGTFTFSTTDTVSYEITISRDGVDFDPANPQNRMLTGIAFSGNHSVDWDGLDNNFEPFPASATPYSYRAYGRNGEVHFPIIDAENNGNPGNANVPGGGPTITRLNGTDAGDRRVFFDDRGWVSKSGIPFGVLNGDLCNNTGNTPASPAEALEGVDSATSYRLWGYGGNSNSDCAASAGWGDAKAVNLWTYFLTPETEQFLDIQEVPVDVATRITGPATFQPGNPVQALVDFYNYGGSTAGGVSYSLSLPAGLTDVTLGNLPVGAGFSYDNGSGAVTFTGMPASLAAGAAITGISVSFTAPADGPLLLASAIDTSDEDSQPANNQDSLPVYTQGVDLSTEIIGLPEAAEAGETVSGQVRFRNPGSEDASGVSYSFTIGSPGATPADVQFPSLPAGASASYDAGTGVVTLSGVPDALTSGQLFSVGFSFTMPDSGPVPVSSGISSAETDVNPANNPDDAAVLLKSLLIVASAECVQDAPYLVYEITPVNFTPASGATIVWEDGAGNPFETLPDQPLSGRMLWPGAAVDASGNGVAWPGWRFENGLWIQEPSPLRPEATVTLSVNPSATITLGYPPATPACATNPPIGTSTTGGFLPAAPPADNTHAVPLLPLPALLSLVALVLAAGARQLRRH